MYKMVERECERIEVEVRDQVEREMRARKESKRKKAVASFDDVKGWERRIRDPIQYDFFGMFLSSQNQLNLQNQLRFQYFKQQKIII